MVAWVRSLCRPAARRCAGPVTLPPWQRTYACAGQRTGTPALGALGRCATAAALSRLCTRPAQAGREADLGRRVVAGVGRVPQAYRRVALRRTVAVGARNRH